MIWGFRVSFGFPTAPRYQLDVLIRPETPDDYPVIRNVNLAAFGSRVEATLVERLRDDKLVIASLLAVDDAGHAVGHILFSPVTIMTSTTDDVEVASLAPMSVVPLHQRKEIGSMLIKHGVEACRGAHYRAIVFGWPSELLSTFRFLARPRRRTEEPICY